MPDYPILQQNKPIGTLTVTQAGLFTVFSARAKADADRLRLAVCGDAYVISRSKLIPARWNSPRWPVCTRKIRVRRLEVVNWVS